MPKTQFEKQDGTGANLGFDFQFLVFVWKLLDLNENESISYENKDDVHIELSNGELILFQIKHSIQKTAKSENTSLTDSDTDLWKTLSNWSKIISDDNDGRANFVDQKDFIKNTKFILLTNKKTPGKSIFIESLSKLQSGTINFSSFISLLDKITTERAKEAIKQILTLLGDSNAELFFTRIVLDLSIDGIEKKIKSCLNKMMIDEKRIDSLYSEFLGTLFSQKFETMKQGEKLTLSFESYRKHYRRIFDIHRNSNLQFKKFTPEISGNIFSQTFLKQLIDINDIDVDSDKDLAIKYTTEKLSIFNNLKEMKINGDLTEKEVDEFYEEVVSIWLNSHRKSHRHKPYDSDKEHNIAAVNHIDHLRESQLRIAGTDIPIHLSNGVFYHLSGVPMIGWRTDWEKKYLQSGKRDCDN